MSPKKPRKRSSSEASCGDNATEPAAYDLGEVLKSPIDSKRYKLIELRNGLKALLVSTCVHELSGGRKFSSQSDRAMLTKKIKEFDDKHLSFQPTQTNSDEAPKKKMNSTPKYNQDQELTNFYVGPLPDIISVMKTSYNYLHSHLSPPQSKNPKLIRCCQGAASLAIAVGAGSFHDPLDVGGMAHLVEHAVFLGSKKFPKPSQLFIEVAQNGGVVNATTFSEQTIYFFHCNMAGFENCAKIMVDGIANPILDETVIRNEIKMLDSEYDIKQSDDPTRINDFTRSLSKKNHPMGGFYWGNKKSLNHENIIKRMKAWRERYYKASYMTVCIQAPIPIEDIEKMVVEHFSDIPAAPENFSHPLKDIACCGNPFGNRKKKKYLIMPVGRLTCLEIAWCLPSKFWQDYQSKPLHYVRTILNCSEQGGLIDFMKKRKWIASCEDVFANCSCSDYYCKTSFGSQFTISVFLTDKGYDKKEEVVEAIFSYIKFLQKCGIQKSYYDEMKKTFANAFHFQNWEDLMETGKSAVLALQYVNPIHVLTSQKLVTRYYPNVIQDCLNHLKPREACFMFVSQKNLESCMKKACECGIRYVEEPITEEQYKKLEDIEPYSTYFKPFPPGTFLAKEISLECGRFCTKSKDGIHEANPKFVMYHEGEWTANPCTEISQKVPSAVISITFTSPTLSEEPRLGKGVLDLWMTIIQEKVIRTLGYQYYHLFAFDLAVETEGVTISVTGPSCNLAELTVSIINTIFIDPDDLKSSKSFFEDMRLNFFRDIVNELFDVEVLANDVSEFIRVKNHVPKWEMKNVIGALSHREFIQLTEKFTRSMKVFVAMQGAVYQQGVESIKKAIKRIKYKTRGIPDYVNQCTMLPRGETKLCIQGFHPAYVTSVVINFYQLGMLNTADFGYFQILYHYMRRRIFNQLRTCEQLGYTVVLRPSIDCGVAGLYAIVLTQPKNYCTGHIEKRIDNFMQKFFEMYLLNCDVEPSDTLFKNHIKTKKEFLQLRRFYQNYLLAQGDNFQKLSIQVVGYLPNQKISVEKEKELNPHTVKEEMEQELPLQYLLPKDKPLCKDRVQYICQIDEFKKNLKLYPEDDTNF